jgi:hypothetical protein
MNPGRFASMMMALADVDRMSFCDRPSPSSPLSLRSFAQVDSDGDILWI